MITLVAAITSIGPTVPGSPVEQTYAPPSPSSCIALHGFVQRASAIYPGGRADRVRSNQTDVTRIRPLEVYEDAQPLME
ncbi:hypothetical protein EVAR_57653_1 [Eumeta japonica]|uniref:Uncharacterized protein n=1 Tax=Eumeta variegata TaxID=151549 RepID=A0A4C1Z0L2_EUMVA|nr:hypothetical protein EVAR_57653_1 [Eumeta japonica]